MAGWDFLVDARPPHAGSIVWGPAPSAPGSDEAVLQVEKFALTTNNLTYARTGDTLGYFEIFGRVGQAARLPAWGYARVIASQSVELPVGSRIFGLTPMGSHMRLRPRRVSGGVSDTADHRRPLNPAYNFYLEAAPDELPANEDRRAVFRPLALLALVLAAHLEERLPEGQVIITSASSKTALLLAHMCRARGLRCLGFTGAAHLDFVVATGLFASVLPYEAAAEVAAGPSILVDFAGVPTTLAAVGARLAGDLRGVISVGATHGASELGGTPSAEFFFGPDHIRRRVREWGAETFETRLALELDGFLLNAAHWIADLRGQGPDALAAQYARLAANRADPREACVIYALPELR